MKFIRHIAIAAALALLSLAPLPAFAQGIVVNAQDGVATGPSVRGVTDPNAGLYFGTGFTGFSKHVAGGGLNTPTVATCGTGSVATGSSDFAGKITATGATACTLTFATAFTTAPACVVTDGTTAAALKVVVTTTTAAVTGLTSGDIFYYVCIGLSGG